MSTTNESRHSPDSQGAESASLERELTTRKIVFMVVAGAGPLAASCAVLPVVFALSSNPVSPLYFVAAAVVLTVFSVGFTMMSRHVRNAGAFYAYVQAGLGKIPGGGAASLALVSYSVLVIGVYAYFGIAGSAAADEFLGLALPWWLVSLAAVVVVGLLGYRSVELNAKILGVLLVAEIILVLIVNLAIVLKGGESGLSGRPLDPSGVLEGAPGLGITFAFLGFLGFEGTAVFRSEAKDPERTIPRATYISVALIGLLYCLTAWCIAVGIGPSRVVEVAGADPGNTFQDLAVTYVGTVMRDLITLLLLTSLLAALLTFQNVIARYQFNLARARLLPPMLGKVHAVHRAPSQSSAVASVVSFTALAGLTVGGVDPLLQIYAWFTGIASLGIISLMALTSLAVLAFHRKNPGSDPVWNAVVAPVMSLIGLGYALYMMVRNFDLLIGGEREANIIFALAILTFAMGAAVVAVAKFTRPERYEAMLEQ